jgi:hypothetical protein
MKFRISAVLLAAVGSLGLFLSAGTAAADSPFQDTDGTQGKWGDLYYDTSSYPVESSYPAGSNSPQFLYGHGSSYPEGSSYPAWPSYPGGDGGGPSTARPGG